MDEAAPPEPGAAAEKKRPLLRRVPTSLVVTLLGIALTAWLLPAFTRQWDDRQKAHALAATIGEQMAASTARILEQTRTKLYRQNAPILMNRRVGENFFAPSFGQAETDWSVASARIEATLLASYPSNLVIRWRALRELVSGWVEWYDNIGHHWEPLDQPDGQQVLRTAMIKVSGAGGPFTALGQMHQFASANENIKNLEAAPATVTKTNPLPISRRASSAWKRFHLLDGAGEASVCRALAGHRPRGPAGDARRSGRPSTGTCRCPGNRPWRGSTCAR